MNEIETVVAGSSAKSASVVIGKELDVSTLVLQDDVACLSDYDDDSTDAKCIWNFCGPDGLAAELIYRLPECAFDSRFYFDGKIVEGSEVLDDYLVGQLPEQDLNLVSRWTEAYHDGGIDQVWTVDQEVIDQVTVQSTV
jgi:hypothetical protein